MGIVPVQAQQSTTEEFVPVSGSTQDYNANAMVFIPGVTDSVTLKSAWELGDNATAPKCAIEQNTHAVLSMSDLAMYDNIYGPVQRVDGLWYVVNVADNTQSIVQGGSATKIGIPLPSQFTSGNLNRVVYDIMPIYKKVVGSSTEWFYAKKGLRCGAEKKSSTVTTNALPLQNAGVERSSSSTGNFQLNWTAPSGVTTSGYKVSIFQKTKSDTGTEYSSQGQPTVLPGGTTTYTAFINNADFYNLKFEIRALYDNNAKESAPYVVYYPVGTGTNGVNGNSTNSTNKSAAPVSTVSSCIDNKACVLSVGTEQQPTGVLMSLDVAARPDLSVRMFADGDDANAKELLTKNPTLDKQFGLPIVPVMFGGPLANVYVAPVQGLEIGKTYKFNVAVVRRATNSSTPSWSEWPDIGPSKKVSFTVKAAETASTPTATPTEPQNECKVVVIPGLSDFGWEKDDNGKVVYKFKFTGSTDYKIFVKKTSGDQSVTIPNDGVVQSDFSLPLDPGTAYYINYYAKDSYNASNPNEGKNTYSFTTASLGTGGADILGSTGGKVPASSLCTRENTANCYTFEGPGGKTSNLWDLFPASWTREQVNKAINSAPAPTKMAKEPVVTKVAGSETSLKVQWDTTDAIGWVNWSETKDNQDGSVGGFETWKELGTICEDNGRHAYQIRYTKLTPGAPYSDIIAALSTYRNNAKQTEWPSVNQLPKQDGVKMQEYTLAGLDANADYAIATQRVCMNSETGISPFAIFGTKTGSAAGGAYTFKPVSSQTSAVPVTTGAQCHVATINGVITAVAKPDTPTGVEALIPTDVAKIKLDGNWVNNTTIRGVYYLTASGANSWEKATVYIQDESGTPYRLGEYYTDVDLTADDAQIQIKESDGSIKPWRGVAVVGLAPGSYKLGLAYTVNGVMSDPGWLETPLGVDPYTPPSTISSDDLQAAPTKARFEIDETSGVGEFNWDPVSVENITGYEIGELNGDGEFSSVYYLSAEKYRDFGQNSGLEGKRPPTTLTTQLYRRGSDGNARPYKFYVRPTYFVYKRADQFDGTSPVVDENGKRVGFDADAGPAAKITLHGEKVAFPEVNYPVKNPIYAPLSDKPALPGCRVNAVIAGASASTPTEISLDTAQDVKVTMTVPANAIEQPQQEFLPKYYLSNGISNQVGKAPADSEYVTPDCRTMSYKEGFYGSKTSPHAPTAEYPHWVKSDPVVVDERELLTPSEITDNNQAQKAALFQTKWNALSREEKMTHLRKIGIYIDSTSYGFNGVPTYNNSDETYSPAQKQKFLNDQILGYLALRNQYNNTCEFTIPAANLKQGINTYTMQGFLYSHYNYEYESTDPAGRDIVTNKCTDNPPQLKIGVAVRTLPTIVDPTVVPDSAELALSTEREQNVISTPKAVINFGITDTTDSAVICKLKDSTTNTFQQITCNKGANTYKHTLSGAGGERTLTLYVENGLGENTEWSQKIVYEDQLPMAQFTGIPLAQVDGTNVTINLACDPSKGDCKKLAYIIQDAQVPNMILKQVQSNTCTATTGCAVEVNRGSSYTKYVYAVMTTRGGVVAYSTPQKIEFKQPLPSPTNPGDIDGPGDLPDVDGPDTDPVDPGTNPDPVDPVDPVDTDTDVPAGAPSIEVQWGATSSYIRTATIAPTVNVSHTADSVVAVLFNGTTEVARKTINKADYNTAVPMGTLTLNANASNMLAIEANATGATEKSRATTTIVHDALQPAVTVEPAQLAASGKVITWNFKVLDASPVTQVRVKGKNTITGDKVEETLTLKSNGYYTFTIGNGTKKLVPGHTYMLDVFAKDIAGNGGLTPNTSSSEVAASQTKREEKNPLLQLIYIGDKTLDGELVNVRMTRGTYVYAANDVPKGPNLLLSDIVERGFANTNGQKASKLPSGTYQVEVSSKANASQKYTFPATIAPYYYATDGDLNGDGKIGLIDQVLKAHGESIGKYSDKEGNSELQEDFGKVVSAIQNAINQNIRLFYRL